MTTTDDLLKERRRLKAEADSIAERIKAINLELFRRDLVVWDAMVEKGYREGCKPTDPPTYAEWLAAQSKKKVTA